MPAWRPNLNLTPDGRLLFATRSIRLFAYGLLSVVLGLYLAASGLTNAQIGLVFSITLVGDIGVSLLISTRADRVGRKRMLVVGAGLMVLAGVIFAASSSFAALLFGAALGILSPSGNEIGPFLSIEQAALSHSVADSRRTHVFAWYNLAGSVATAIGALAGGATAQLAGQLGYGGLGGYRVVIWLYAGLGALLVSLFCLLSPAIEVHKPASSTAAGTLGLGSSKRVVMRLSALFALDAFGGGFALQSFMALWLHARHGASPALLGAIFFGANILAAVSALAAAGLAARFGLINTMVYTHIPSNVLLILVPLMPNLPLAILVLLLRFSISQMDVPTRQSYTMAVVRPEERSAAAGVTAVARSIGAAGSPLIAGAMFSSAALFSVPFFAAGAIKIVYDLLLYQSFRSARPPEEERMSSPSS